MKRFAALIAVILVASFMMQTLSLCSFAVTDRTGGLGGILSGSTPGLSGSAGGIGKFDTDATIEQLKKDFLKSVNKDLLLKIEDYELSGPVSVILTFAEDSLIDSYESAAVKVSYDSYRQSATAEKLLKELEASQKTVLDKLWKKGLITEVKYNYYHMLNGAYVSTTYEQIDEICDIEGVERVMISNTYLPAAAVENPVNVYDTGIFNSGDVTYTGKGTVVAILDTGCDYTHTAFTTHTVLDPKYDRDDIEAILKSTMAYGYDDTLEAREVYYGNLTGGKVVFGYDYADKDADVMPFSSEHGTHVAGIIGGKDDTITGVAIDTQLAIMKVFSDYEAGAEDGDILAALEDAIILNVDAINMSLGSSCGFTREADDDYKNDLYDRIEAAGISLIVAASNDYSSGFGSEQGNTNKTHNPDSATVGSPATYNAAFAVASINGNKDKYMLANGNREIFFHEAVNQSAKEYDFFQMLGITADKTVEYEYVTVPGYGLAINYAGLDIAGKIALVRRGEISFEEKVQYAYEAGAIAIIIYNNVFGDISMTVGNDVKIPVVSIGKDDGDAIAAVESGRIAFNGSNQAGPFMSDFSSWGPNPDLSLKPEITAHGGNILSAIPGGGYDKLSGTSMAAPNMCGIVVLIRQYVIEAYGDELSITQIRDLVNQLCMSTATIALDRNGNPYSPRKQGAGIADIAKATQTPAYLYVDGIGKTKLELGDDPARSGVYEMTLNLKNLSDKTVSYRIGNITMTETVSTSDPEYVAEIGHLLSNASEYSVTGGTLENGVVSVEAGKTAKITVKLTLSAEDKAYINASFENGMYVEGFITFDNTEEKGIDLNAPFLAFYGDWSEAPIFDLDYYEVETEAHNDAIDDDDKIKPDYYATTPVGTYYYDYMLPLGSYVYEMGPDDIEIPATEEKAAISYYADSISGIYGVFCGLLRGAKQMNISIVDTTTGEEVWSDVKYNCYKSHYNGSPFPYIADLKLPMANYQTGDVFGYNNTRFEVTMSAVLDWDGTQNSSDTYTFSFYIDYEAPTVTGANFRTEYDKSQKKNRYYADIMVYDNQYAMSLRPIIVYEYEGEDAELEDEKSKKTYSSLCEYPIPIYQDNRGEITKVTVEITDYIDLIKNSSMPEGLTVYLDDYAMNSSVCYIPFPETENTDLTFKTPELSVNINDTLDLATYLVGAGNEAVETDYLKNLTWTSSDPSVVAIHGGKIEALKSGSATVSVTGSGWTYKETVNGEEVEKPLYKTIVINVSETESKNPDSAENVQIEKLEFTSFKTLFAFNSDIDYSEIGLTGSINYFGGYNNIAFYPSEKVQLYYNLEPWNLSPDRYELKWSSSNPKVATVDEDGVVTAEAEGKARITLQITIDGKTSLLAARCSIEVKSEFVIENRTLIAYKGKGGEVVIPDDEGIMTIGAFAFSHYDLDNEKEVEKDEDGNYDMDDKKSPLGNSTVTSVVIPEGIETISKYAFYRCSKLSSVTLPASCKTIAEYAFYECEVLENVNLDRVQTISDYAFYHCDSLTCEELGGINLSGVSSIGKYAFAGCRVKSVSLTNLSSSGIGAFQDCKYLKTVELGRKTRLAPSMFENTAVESVTVYSDTVPDAAFRGCEKLTTVVLKRDLTYLGEEAFNGCKRLKSVTFEGICEEIAAFAFYDCTMLKSFTLPDCEVVIGDAAFADTSLETFIFNKNTYLESFGIRVFEGVEGMTFDVSRSDYYKEENGVIYSKDGTRLVMIAPDAVLGDFVVPAGVKEICDGAFSSNSTLTSLSFAADSRIEKIGYGAFANCTALMRVTLPDHNVEIGGMAFYEARLLSSINLENV
ncbi:MAG: leucine-rich repeat protein, partial [Clostridia bacterium]|nr:leucine-rich repeat protein [Clostridia bacterium]